MDEVSACGEAPGSKYRLHFTGLAVAVLVSVSIAEVDCMWLRGPVPPGSKYRLIFTGAALLVSVSIAEVERLHQAEVSACGIPPGSKCRLIFTSSFSEYS